MLYSPIYAVVCLIILGAKGFLLCDKECGKTDVGSACNIKYGFCSPSCSTDSDCSKVRGATSLKLSCGQQGHCEPQDDLISFLYGSSKSVDRPNPLQPVPDNNQQQEVYPNLVGATDWNLLETSWSLDPMSGYSSIPKDVNEANQKGYQKLMDITDPGSPGYVYINKNRDLSSMPIFNADGLITGIIMAVSDCPDHIKRNPAKYSFTEFNLQKYRMKYGLNALPAQFYGVTVLFRDPSSIGSRDQSGSDLIGNRLLIASSNFDCNDQSTFSFDVMAPMSDAEGYDGDLLKGMGFRKGSCFFQTGYHYFQQPDYFVDCKDFYPPFLVYNNNKLVGFGLLVVNDGDVQSTDSSRHWQQQWDMQNTPLASFFGGNVPQCMQGRTVSMQHAFLVSPSQWECQDNDFGGGSNWLINKKGFKTDGFVPGGTKTFLGGLGSQDSPY